MKKKTLKAKTRLIILMGIAVSLWIVLMTVYVAVMMFLLTSCAPQITSTRYNPEGYTDSTEYCWYIPTDTGWVHHCEFHYHEPGFKIYPEGGVYQENDSIIGTDTSYFWIRD